MKEEVKKIIKGKENEMFLAKQCCNYLGFFCHNTECKNTCCVLNKCWEKLKFNKKKRDGADLQEKTHNE